ncbi:hypothetical protein [Treponema sp.]|uniref:hypothetical protein n=1 Tax=Treponema sp. TaxID=166 RepID=UPI00257A0F4F|nr:hypothetical protein [Treponema sp.]
MANEPKEHASVKAAEAKAAPAAPAKAKEESADKVLSGAAAVEHFNKYIQLIVAKVTKIETNSQGDKLYIETLDDGSGTPRIIQSGLRPYLKEEEILGKNVIIAANLAPRKMKGVESHGMLLAADYEEDGKEKVELLTAPWAAPGTQVILEGESECEKPAKIDIDRFCKIDYRITEKHAQAAGKNLVAAGQPIVMEKTVNGEIS